MEGGKGGKEVVFPRAHGTFGGIRAVVSGGGVLYREVVGEKKFSEGEGGFIVYDKLGKRVAEVFEEG